MWILLHLAISAGATAFRGCPAESEIRRFLTIEAGADFAPADSETTFICDVDIITISVTASSGESLSHVLHLGAVRASARPRTAALATVELWRGLREAEAERAIPPEPPALPPASLPSGPAGFLPLPPAQPPPEAAHRLLRFSLSLGHDASNIYASELSGINLGYYGSIAEGLQLFSFTRASLLLSTFTPIDVGAQFRFFPKGRWKLSVELEAAATLHTLLATEGASFWTANGQSTFTANYDITKHWSMGATLSVAGRYLPLLSASYGRVFRVVFVPGVRLQSAYYWSRYSGIAIDAGVEIYVFGVEPQRDPSNELQLANTNMPRISITAGPQWRW